MAAPSKEAVVFILDASTSMKRPYHIINRNKGSNAYYTSTKSYRNRLSCAKGALERLVCNLILQSKTNEASVIILKTSETRHHLCNDFIWGNDKRRRNGIYKKEDNNNNHAAPPLLNLTELNPLQRPSIDLLRSIRNIKVDNKISHSGDFCDGIIVAASALYKRTNKKRYRRKIVLFTDATQKVRLLGDHYAAIFDEAVNRLREMKCQLMVVGLNFRSNAIFGVAADVAKYNKSDDIADWDDYNDLDDNIDIDDEGNFSSKEELLVQRENEKLLLNLTKWISGQVFNPSSIGQFNFIALKERSTRSTLSKIELRIAPDLYVKSCISLCTSKANIPSLKREAIRIDPQDECRNPLLDSACDAITTPVQISNTHWDEDDPDREIEFHERTTAIPFGCDLIPFSTLDMEGLKRRSLPVVTILGYVPKESIPIWYMIGPARVVSGERTSMRAQAVISALAQALWKLRRYAVCTFVSRVDADPLMGILSPLEEEEKKEKRCNRSPQLTSSDPQYLLYIRIPFSDDWQKIQRMPLVEDDINISKDSREGDLKELSCAREVVDNLIDSLIIPPKCLLNESIPNPAIESFYKTLVNRAIDPAFTRILSARCVQQQWIDDSKLKINDEHHVSEEVKNKNKMEKAPLKENSVKDSFEGEGQNDSMSTPREILEKSRSLLNRFHQFFPLQEVVQGTNKKGVDGKKKRIFWSDFD